MILLDLHEQLVKGWNERIEYSVETKVHTDECRSYSLGLGIYKLRHYECSCVSIKEVRIEHRPQLPILTQLVEAGYTVPVIGSGSGGSSATNKPQSKPPGNLVEADQLLFKIEALVKHYAFALSHDIISSESESVADILTRVTDLLIRNYDPLNRDNNHWNDRYYQFGYALKYLVHKARIFLGYETPSFLLEESCEGCGGVLMVFPGTGRPTVKCMGTSSGDSCGAEYPWHTWADMANNSKRKLVGTREAVLWTGRDRGTLYRWAHEGRITKYGGRGKGKALWDLEELPQKKPGEEFVVPPLLTNGD